MKIGCDIDGVVANIGKTLLKYIRQVEPEAKLDNIVDYNLLNFGFEDRHMKKMFKSFEHTGDYTSIEPIEGAIEGTHKLSKTKHQLAFLTARNDYPGVIQETFDWLKKHDFRFDIFMGGQRDKYSICKKLEIDLMIEDNPSQIYDCSNRGLDTICYRQPWNQEIEETEKIKIAKNWDDVITIIKNENRKKEYEKNDKIN